MCPSVSQRSALTKAIKVQVTIRKLLLQLCSGHGYFSFHHCGPGELEAKLESEAIIATH